MKVLYTLRESDRYGSKTRLEVRGSVSDDKLPPPQLTNVVVGVTSNVFLFISESQWMTEDYTELKVGG